MDDPGGADEGDSRAPGTAERPRDRGPACGRAPAHRLDAGAVRRAGLYPARAASTSPMRGSPKLLEQLGFGAVPHGFRSSFRDWASERTNHPRPVVEAAPAHIVRGQTEKAYARSDLFDRRRQLMADWMQDLDPERGQMAAAAAGTDARRRDRGPPCVRQQAWRYSLLARPARRLSPGFGHGNRRRRNPGGPRPHTRSEDAVRPVDVASFDVDGLSFHSVVDRVDEARRAMRQRLESAVEPRRGC